ATTVVAPGAWEGSIMWRRPGFVNPFAKTRPIAMTIGADNSVADVHVPRSLPSEARTRDRLEPDTQTSAPSNFVKLGLESTVVWGRTAPAFGVENCPSAARRLPRFRTASTLRERKAAIWRRLTLPAGSYVVAVVPVVIPREKISRTKGQNTSAATSVNGPQGAKGVSPAPASKAI